MSETIKKKVGWYLPIYQIEAINNIVIESREFGSEVAKEIIDSGLANSPYLMLSERLKFKQIHYKNIIKRLVYSLNIKLKQEQEITFETLISNLSSCRATKSMMYSCVFFDLKEFLDVVKKESPDVHKGYMVIIKKYKKIYKEFRTVEPQNSTVLYNTNNNISIELNDEEYIKAGKMRGHEK